MLVPMYHINQDSYLHWHCCKNLKYHSLLRSQQHDTACHPDILEIIYYWRNNKLKKTKLRGLSPRANYTNRATAAWRRSQCQLLRVNTACNLKLKLIYDRQSVGQSVLVSGTHLGPVTNFSFPLKFPLDSCGFVIL
jgi:hypothetical protein